MADVADAAPVSDLEFATALQALKPQLPIAVAVSGGADSLALLMLVSRWAEKAGAPAKLLALSVDHGLRETAAAELEQVALWCRSLGIAHKTLQWRGLKPASDIQAAARGARYRLLVNACTQQEISCLLLGHQLEDQAETFLLRLGRGSGVDGLGAMAEVREWGGVRILRPLLGFSKHRLRATLKHLAQPWIEDPSNGDRRFARVRARHLLEELTQEGLSPERLAATARRMRRAREALDHASGKIMSEVVQWHNGGFAYLTLSPLLGCPEEITLRVLAKLLMAVSGEEYPPRLAALERLLEWLRRSPRQGGRTLSGCCIAPRQGRIAIARELAAVGPEVHLMPGEHALWDSRFRVQLSKNAPLGGTVRAVGVNGLQQLRKIAPQSLPPSFVCHAMPGLWQGPDLIAAPSLGFRQPDAAADLSGFVASFAPHRMSSAF